MLFLIIFILCFIAGFILPWWIIALIAFLAAFFSGRTPVKSFGAGFLAVATAWVILALIKSIPNENVLAGRVATLFHLPGWLWLVFVTAIIGGLAGGLAGLSGALFRRASAKTEKR